MVKQIGQAIVISIRCKIDPTTIDKAFLGGLNWARGMGYKDTVMGRQIASVIILEHATLNLKERYTVKQG